MAWWNVKMEAPISRTVAPTTASTRSWARRLTWIERTGGKAVTSTITMTELLVQPYRAVDQQQADEFYVLLSTFPNLEWIAPNLEIADRAAKLRALHGLRTADALHAATAVHAGATGLVANDSVFERVKDFETMLLDKLL